MRGYGRRLRAGVHRGRPTIDSKLHDYLTAGGLHLPIDRPRRIFRSGRIASRQGRRRIGGPFLAGIVGLFCVAAVLAIGLPVTLFGRVPGVSGTVVAGPQHVAVVDGDTLRLRDTVIRLLGVLAPPRGTSCRADTDCGAVATEALASLVRDQEVVCHLDGRARDGFPQAMCDAGGKSINHALVATGYARAIADTGVFADDEHHARTDHRGLWRDGPF